MEDEEGELEWLIRELKALTGVAEDLASDNEDNLLKALFMVINIPPDYYPMLWEALKNYELIKHMKMTGKVAKPSTPLKRAFMLTSRFLILVSMNRNRRLKELVIQAKGQEELEFSD